MNPLGLMFVGALCLLAVDGTTETCTSKLEDHGIIVKCQDWDTNYLETSILPAKMKKPQKEKVESFTYDASFSELTREDDGPSGGPATLVNSLVALTPSPLKSLQKFKLDFRLVTGFEASVAQDFSEGLAKLADSTEIVALELNFEGTPLDSDTLQPLCTGLRAFTTLETLELGLQGTGLHAKHVTALAGALAQLKSLQTLRLRVSHNHLGDDGLLKLARGISEMDELVEIVLEAQDLDASDAGSNELADSLARLKPSRVTLDLSSNRVSANGAQRLARAFSTDHYCKNLETLRLQLRGDEIGASGFRDLTKTVEKMEALLDLHLDLAFCGLQKDEADREAVLPLIAGFEEWLEHWSWQANETLDLTGNELARPHGSKITTTAVVESTTPAGITDPTAGDDYHYYYYDEGYTTVVPDSSIAATDPTSTSTTTSTSTSTTTSTSTSTTTSTSTSTTTSTAAEVNDTALDGTASSAGSTSKSMTSAKPQIVTSPSPSTSHASQVKNTTTSSGLPLGAADLAPEGGLGVAPFVIAFLAMLAVGVLFARHCHNTAQKRQQEEQESLTRRSSERIRQLNAMAGGDIENPDEDHDDTEDLKPEASWTNMLDMPPSSWYEPESLSAGSSPEAEKATPLPRVGAIRDREGLRESERESASSKKKPQAGGSRRFPAPVFVNKGKEENHDDTAVERPRGGTFASSLYSPLSPEVSLDDDVGDVS